MPLSAPEVHQRSLTSPIVTVRGFRLGFLRFPLILLIFLDSSLQGASPGYISWIYDLNLYCFWYFPWFSPISSSENILNLIFIFFEFTSLLIKHTKVIAKVQRVWLVNVLFEKSLVLLFSKFLLLYSFSNTDFYAFIMFPCCSWFLDHRGIWLQA